MTTLFFFGSLRDRELLEVVLGRPVSSEDRRGAVALGYQARTLAAEAYPHLAPTPGNRADGIVVSNLTAADLDRLIYFEEAEYGLAPIDVQTDAGVVSAQYFQATAKAVPTDDVWDFDAWTRTERDTALAAAEELMSHKGLVPLEEMDSIWPGVMIRAFMRARAKSEKPVRGRLRGAWTRNDVQSISVTRPYTHYFAIEDHTLRHRRFDGSWSPEIRRTALTSGDAVTVLPFDPLTL
ncbi:MAG: gamma-glutamylcyclotransferase [Pseudomonadota bacterium]